MLSSYHTPTISSAVRKWLLIISLIIPVTAFSQQVQWEILSPMKDSSVSNDNLFISVRINDVYQFEGPSDVKILLDNKEISGFLKVIGNRISLLYTNFVPNGLHKIRIEAKIADVKNSVFTEWHFYVNKGKGGKYTATTQKEGVKLAGTVSIDNRSVFLSGTGENLRQEPDHTTSLNVDVQARYKNAVLPVKVYVTSNNRYSTQSMNYYQVGFKNKWLDLEAGDLNPMFDRLILSGVRLRGIKAMVKFRANSIQYYYGELNKSVEGELLPYTPGSGITPSNLVNDTQYISPGVYRRMMSAIRIETGNRKEIFKIGLNAFKAKDEIGSIKYGVAPKENVAGGLDFTVKLFKKKVVLQSGAALSILTNNAEYGILDKETLDTTYHVETPFDPKAFGSIITLNASTVPVSLEAIQNGDNLAYYTQLNYTNKYQSFFFEYRKNGALYYSLGNPFLRNNYAGFSVGDRFALWKRKLSFDLMYQNYSNDLNNSLPTKVVTNVYRANLFVNISEKVPSVFFNYMSQGRKGETEIPTMPGVNDVMVNYTVGLNYNKSFWNLDHSFRVLFTANDRNDLLRPQNKFSSYNVIAGIGEKIGKRFRVNADFGKVILNNAKGERISDINIYNIGLDCQIKEEKLFTTLLFSNNQTLATGLTGDSYRLSATLRVGYRFLKGMGLDLEGGYAPYRDKTNPVNDYNESFVYLRYSCDLGRLFN